MQQLCSHWTDFYKIWYLCFFLENLSRKFKFHQDMTRVLYVKTNTYFLLYLAQLFLEWEMFRTNVVEEIKTYVFCPITFFPKIVSFMRQCGKILYSQRSHRWQYGSHCMLDNWGYKHILRIRNTYCFSIATMVTLTRLYVTLYYTACLTCISNSFASHLNINSFFSLRLSSLAFLMLQSLNPS
jgi:hypothetical protein